jgi:hypothetical protein
MAAISVSPPALRSIRVMIPSLAVTSIGNSAFSRLETRQAGMNIFVAVWGEPVCFAKRIGDDRSV